MTDKEVLERAYNYVFQMANGIDPLTGNQVKDDDLINNVRISRCLFYVSGVLKNVLNGDNAKKTGATKKDPFYITPEELSKYEYSDTPIALSVIVEKLNSLVDLTNKKKLTYSKIIPGLIADGILEVEVQDGKNVKRPTEKGMSIGISVEARSGQSGIYYVVIYDRNAQQYIVDNIYSFIDTDNVV